MSQIISRKKKQKRMIVLVNRMGGLGNQLFQYAAARAVVFHHPQSYLAVEDERDNSHNHKHYDYAQIFMKDALCLRDCSFNEFHQRSSFAPWDPVMMELPVKLCGYFQYYPALVPILKDVIQQFKEALQPYCQQEVCQDTSVFLHVRRGDYLNLPHYHYVQSKDYYEEAFRQWKHQYGDHPFQLFLISDDPVWCREQSWSFPFVLYDNEDEVETLALMSQCRAGAIIANSSYSYWGALVSETEHVYYPNRWIAETVYHLFPPHWKCVVHNGV